MKKLKIILQYKYLYIFISIVVCLVTLIRIYYRNDESIYDINDNKFHGIVNNLKVKDDKISFILDSEEDLICNYYLKDNELISIKDGMEVTLDGSLSLPKKNSIFNNFNYRKYLNNKDIYYILEINNFVSIKKSDNIIVKLRYLIDKRVNMIDKKGYLKAFILGNKDDLEEDIYNNYKNIGITHIFALSGMHISLLSQIILKLLKRLKELKKYLILNVILIIYGYIVSFPISIKRCIIFYVINSFNKLLKLNIDSKYLFVLTINILILNNYKIIYDIGFLYGTITISGIYLAKCFIEDRSKFKSIIKLSFITFLFSMPISLYNFYSINLLSVIYNIVFIPLISSIIYPLSLISFIVPFVYKLLLFFINILEYCSNAFANIDIFRIYTKLSIFEIIIYYFVLVYVFINDKYKYLIINFLVIFINLISPRFDNNLYVYYFDVGQGDSSLIILPNRKSVIMIDTGGNEFSNYKVSDGIINFLHSKGIGKIDYLLISHGDADHILDGFNVVNQVDISNVVFNCGIYNDLEKELIDVLNEKNVKYYSCINELNIDKYKLLFLNTREYDNENDNSSVIYFKFIDYKFLFMGDASITTEKEIMNKYNLPNIDVLKVGHHGSKTSSSKEFINEINPKYSIISVGKKNRYGHPKEEVLETLKNSKIYRTDLDGSIEIILNKNGYKIRTCPP